MTPASRQRTLQIAPALLIIGFFMVAPLGLMAYVSLLEKGVNGGVIWDQHTAEAYVNFIFERDLDDSLIVNRSEEHTSELQSLMRISYAVFCLKKKKKTHKYT